MNSESKSVGSNSKKLPAFFVGLAIGVIGAGVGTYLFIEHQRSDIIPPQMGSEAEPSLIKGIEVADDSLIVKIDIDGLQRLLMPQSSFERTVTLQSVSDRATELELLGLFASAETVRPEKLRDEIQVAMVRQIAKHRPRNALDQIAGLAEVRRVHIVDIVFQEWSVADLEESIEFAESMDGADQTSALEGILRSRIDLTDDARRGIARRLNNEQVILDQWAASRVQDEYHDPPAEWSEFIEVHGSDVHRLSPEQVNLLASIARSWIGQDGFGEMAQAINTGLANYDASVSIVELLFEQVFVLDPRVVLDSARAMNPETRSVVSRALTNLASRNPDAAFELAFMMEAGGSQVTLQRAAIGGWMQTDPKAVLEARARFPDAFQDWIQQSTLMSMIRTMPDEVPQFIPTISDNTQLEVVVNNLAVNWARTDPLAVYEWLQSEPKAQPWSSTIFTHVIENLADRNPEEALRIALNEPPREYDEVGWEASVVAAVARTDVEAAIALMDRTRDEKTRESMIGSIGQVFINQAQYEQAMDWAKKVKEDKREEYYERVIGSWIWGNPEQLYEKMDSLPSDRLREIAANWLIDTNEHQKAFSDAQIEELKKYLPEEIPTTQ